MEPLTRSWISFRNDVMLVRADSAGWRSDQRDHLIENSAGLEPIVGAGVNFAAALRLRATEVTERQGGGELAFSVLPSHAQNRRADRPDAALVLPIDGLDELSLPGTQTELRARVLSGGDLEVLEEGDHPIGAGEPWRIPRVGARDCRFERLAPRFQGFSTWVLGGPYLINPCCGSIQAAYHILRLCEGNERSRATRDSPSAPGGTSSVGGSSPSARPQEPMNNPLTPTDTVPAPILKL